MRYFDPNFLNRLTLQSTIADLPYWEMSLMEDLPGQSAAQLFEQDLSLPAVLVAGDLNRYRGMISRERFYNLIGRRFGVDLFYNRPVRHIMELIPDPGIALDHTTPIALAARACLTREGDAVYEAIVVVYPDRPPRIVDFRDLIVAQTRLLELSNEIAQSASAAKDQFLATMSHELRTPLTSIIGYAELAETVVRRGGDNSTASWITTIHSNGKHLLDLIVGILDLSKIEAGRMELEVGRFDLADLIVDVRTTILPLADKARNQLLVSCPPNVGTMHSDQFKVKQSLLNLLSNACKFTQNGEIELTVERSGAEVTFRIRDTGIGMSEEQMAKVFLPFVQGDSSMTRKYGGTGLGLSITQRFCEMLGGSVTVQSDLGRGTTFVMQLPVLASLPESLSPALPEPTAVPGGLSPAA